MLTKEQANEILETIWHLPRHHPDRLSGTAWLLHQIISWRVDLNVWLYPSTIKEPYYDDFAIIGSATLKIPVNLLNSETALYLMRHCAIIGHVAPKERCVEGGPIRTLRDCTGLPERSSILQAAIRLYLDTGYLSWIEQSKLDPLEVIWKAGCLPAMKSLES
jgi:hypothetical protein